jgi:hypothetical protein
MSNREYANAIVEAERLLNDVEVVLGARANRLWPILFPVNEFLVSGRRDEFLSKMKCLIVRTLENEGAMTAKGLSGMMGLPESILSGVLKGLEVHDKVVRSNADGLFAISPLGSKTLSSDAKIREGNHEYLLRFDGLTGQLCHKAFYDSFVSRKRRSIPWVRVTSRQAPNVVEANSLVVNPDTERADYSLPSDMRELKKLVGAGEPIHIPIFVVELEVGELKAVAPQVSYVFDAGHPICEDLLGLGLEVREEQQRALLQSEIKELGLVNAIVRTSTAAKLTIEVDPAIYRDVSVVQGGDCRLWFPRSGYVAHLMPRTEGF